MYQAMLGLCLGLWMAVAGAAVIEGVPVDDKVKLGAQELVLNGGGLRTKLFFKVYVAALYLPEKKAVAEEIIQAKTPRRLALTIVRDEVSTAQMHDSFRDGITNNHSPAELEQLKPKIAELEAIFAKVTTVYKGDVIVLDFQDGLKISIKGELKGQIAGDDIQRAVLRIWLGPQPAQDSLKKALLGG